MIGLGCCGEMLGLACGGEMLGLACGGEMLGLACGGETFGLVDQPAGGDANHSHSSLSLMIFSRFL
jgi:hypothetical protein